MAGRSCSRPAAASAASAGSPTPRTATSCTCSARCRTASTASTSCSTARTARHPASRPRRSATPARRVTVIGADPDGMNINDGVGSTHLDLARRARRARRRRRRHRPRRRRRPLPRRRRERQDRRRRPDHGDPRRRDEASAAHLVDDTLVATVMSNLGLHRAMARARHPGRRRPRSATATCSRRMTEGGFSLGGEQSGHVIMSEYATTGDGLLTGLHLLGRDGAHRQVARRARLGHDGVPAGARERARRRPLRARRRDEVWRMPSPRSRPSSATPAACCCARPAPSRWCVSWSRPHPPRTRRRHADRLADVVRERLAL